MSGRRRKALSPSLFPFLAVLVCTLGTLILLLALVAQKANDSAHAKADQKRRELETAAAAEPAPIPGLTSKTVAQMVEDEAYRVEQLISFRDQQTADVESRRDQIAQVESHMQKLQAELQRLSDEVELAMSSEPIANDAEDEFAKVEQAIASEQAKIDELKETKGSGKPRVVIVPHKGPNGTDRRPVYLECTAEGLTVWPEQSLITVPQLLQADPGANPVEAALRVIRQHSMLNYGDTVPPYPLLVVRPDGIETYAAARFAMKDYEDQFGYELVPGEVRLAIPKSDANLKRKVDAAIALAAQKQSRIAAIAQRNNQKGGGRLPVLSAASLDRQGRTSGFRRLTRDETNLWTSDSASSSQSARSYASTKHQSQVGNNLGSNPSKGVAPSVSGSYGRSGMNSAAGTSPGGIDPKTERRWHEDMQAAAAELRGRSGNGNMDLAIQDSLAGGPPKSDNELVSGSENANGTSNATNESFPPTDSQSNGKQSNDDAAASSVASANADQTSDQRINGPGGSAPSGQSPPQTGSSSAGPPPSRYSQMSNDQLAGPGRDNWAIPQHAAGMGGNAIVRTIRAECHADRFVLLPPTRGGATEVFGVLNQDSIRATRELATAIRDRVQRWGVALPGGHWQPTLEMTVQPGGQRRFLQFQRIMEGSGVDIVPRLP